MANLNIFADNDAGQLQRQGLRDELTSLLPTQRQIISPAFPAKEVTKVALRLKYQLEQVVPCELELESITRAHSSIVTPAVVKAAKEAGGDEYKSCVVFCLLVCKKWFKRQAKLELWDMELHDARAVACEVIAKKIIEGEEDQDYLMEHVLLKRYSILVDGEETSAVNAVEKAVDIHALRVIGSSGYQRCINYIWRGWLVQDDDKPARFVQYKDKMNTSYWSHFDPDRMRVPKYQSFVQVAFSIIFLVLYTMAINSINPTGDLDVVEGFLYIFTLGFVCDEIAKLVKIGRFYLGFWNVFNSTLYAILTVSFATRMIAIGHHIGTAERERYNVLSYNLLAFTAPMFWLRLMLYLDTWRFFGTMLIVVKVMMKESLIFVVLLFFVCVGFLQAFVGLDQVDEEITETSAIVKGMINSVLQSPDFDAFEKFSPPFGLILYYLFTFIIAVILLNILIALFNSAYEDITENSTDEYMALAAAKCLRFVRAPDENVFIPPLNLVELAFLILPFEWWLSPSAYERLNDVVMGVIYAPLLVVTAFLEQRAARGVRENRRRGEEDDDTTEEWEELGFDVEREDEGWVEKVKASAPNVDVDATGLEVRRLRQEIAGLKEAVEGLLSAARRSG